MINAHPTLPLIIYPSGRFIVVRNINDPADTFIYRGHGSTTTVAKFSNNGFWVASGDSSGKLRVWAWDNPEHLTKLETSLFAGKISDLDWDMESKKIAVSGEGSGLVVKCVTWDTGNNVGEMVGHSKRALSIACKPTRPFRIITASEDMKTCFYEGPPFKLHHSNTSHSNFVNCVRYSLDGNRAISVSSDKKIQAYDGKTGEMTLAVENAHAGGIYGIAFNPESTHFITASADKTIKLWNAESLDLEQTFSIANPQLGDAQVAVVWSKHAIISVSLNGNINIWNKEKTDGPERVIQAHQVGIGALAVDRDAQAVFTGSYDGVVCKRTISTENCDCTRVTGQDAKQMSGASHTGKIVGIAVVQGGLVSAGWDDKLRFSTTDATAAYHTHVDLNGQPNCLATCTTTTDLLLVVTNSEVALYRGASKVSSISVAELGFAPTCGALLNEEEVAIGGADFKTHIYALQNLVFTPVCSIDTRSAVSAVSYSPTGECLAIGDEGRQVELYARGSWEAVVKGKWVYHTSRITCLSWSPEGKYLASGSLDENVFVWNPNPAKHSESVHLAFTHTGGALAVGWLAEGKLVSAGSDGATVTWNVPAF